MSAAELNSYISPPLTEENMDGYLIRSSVLHALKGFLSQCNGVLLDVGCGKMPYKSLIMGLDTKVSKYIGLDIENPLYQKETKPDLFWDGTIIPLDDCSIDCALATEVFEHLPDPEKVMREIGRVLKPNGILFFTVPFLWPLHNVPHDEYRYTPFSLERHLKNSGLDRINIRALGGWDACLAQMIGLWVSRKPMGKDEREKYAREFFPLYRKLIESDRAPIQFIESQMISGLYGTALKPDKSRS
jgi:SAM-dependent methyltransferase